MPCRHDRMENAKEGWEHYTYHKTSPLSNMKVLKTKPILQFLKPSYIHSPQGIPLAPNNCIVSMHFFQQCGILVFITQGRVLFMHFWFNSLFCVFIHKLSLMKVTHSFPIEHQFIWIHNSIHDSHYIQIGLSVIDHETLEIWITNTIL